MAHSSLVFNPCTLIGGCRDRFLLRTPYCTLDRRRFGLRMIGMLLAISAFCVFPLSLRWPRGLGDIHWPQIWDLPKILPSSRDIWQNRWSMIMLRCSGLSLWNVFYRSIKQRKYRPNYIYPCMHSSGRHAAHQFSTKAGPRLAVHTQLDTD